MLIHLPLYPDTSLLLLSTCLWHQKRVRALESRLLYRFSLVHWDWVLAAYQALTKLRAINREDREREELYYLKGPQNVYVMNGSPCNNVCCHWQETSTMPPLNIKDNENLLKPGQIYCSYMPFTCCEVYSIKWIVLLSCFNFFTGYAITSAEKYKRKSYQHLILMF